jgi:hypothetical protein
VELQGDGGGVGGVGVGRAGVGYIPQQSEVQQIIMPLACVKQPVLHVPPRYAYGGWQSRSKDGLPIAVHELAAFAQKNRIHATGGNEDRFDVMFSDNKTGDPWFTLRWIQ